MVFMVVIMPSLTELAINPTELETMDNCSIMAYHPRGLILLLHESHFFFYDLYNDRIILDLPQFPEYLEDMDGWKATFSSTTTYVVGDARNVANHFVRFYILTYTRGTDEWVVNHIPVANDRSSLTLVGPICVDGNLLWVTENNNIEIYYSNGRYNIIPIEVDFDARNCGVSMLEHDGFIYVFKGEPQPIMIRFQIDLYFEEEEYEYVNHPPEGFDFFFLAKGKGFSRAAQHEGDGIIMLAKEAADAHVSAYRDMICLRRLSICREAPNIPGGVCECMFGWFFPS
ncbi:hypothetical protein FRX31_012246 [Thalictrum thalictroides]|uniref:F-box protein n=1 Tax=Thalictrum thalictroides TaxID=46969 RepID=A0A7J6WMK0_THATH|nr:hypothetical protein FRX31_012246 [Thalictrum thalictroides]